MGRFKVEQIAAKRIGRPPVDDNNRLHRMGEAVVYGKSIREAAREVATSDPGELQPATVAERIRRKFAKNPDPFKRAAVKTIAFADLPRHVAYGPGHRAEMLFTSPHEEAEREEEFTKLIEAAQRLAKISPIFSGYLRNRKIDLAFPCYPKLVAAMKRNWKLFPKKAP